MTVTCSIIIRCFNEEKHIGKLLYGISKQTIKDKEIIIVDSGSKDSTLDIVSKFNTRVINIAPSKFSFGRALNLGISEASGEYAVMISAHVYPTKDNWLENLIEPFNDEKVALTYGKQRGDKNTKYSEKQILLKWFPNESKLQKISPFCNNANSAIRRLLWKKIKYDEDLTGLEDIHWAKKAIEKGYYLSYISNAEIIHVHDETPTQIYNRYLREGISLKKAMDKRSISFKEIMSMLVGNIASDLYCAMKEGVLSDNIFEIPMFRMMQMLGTYKGFNKSGDIDWKLKRKFYYPEKIKKDYSKGIEDIERNIDYSGYKDEE